MTRDREYYSTRTGKNPAGSRLDLPSLKKLFASAYEILRGGGYFDEALGYDCVDAGHVPGTLGSDIESAILFAVRKDHLWPLHDRLSAYREDDVFDMIEFLFDNVSKPVDGTYHSYMDCGMHHTSFNPQQGRIAFRAKLNPLLGAYQGGFALNASGEIVEVVDPGMGSLIESSLPPYDPKHVEHRVEAAISRFRHRRSSIEDRRHAIRDLVDVLEFLRPQLATVLTSKDESDLFNLANNFGIRHHNDRQKTDYEPSIWLSWMFYHYLATIHACLRLLLRVKREGNPLSPSR